MRACGSSVRGSARPRKEKKERARRAHRLNTASLWMLALMERNLAAAYIESPQAVTIPWSRARVTLPVRAILEYSPSCSHLTRSVRSL